MYVFTLIEALLWLIAVFSLGLLADAAKPSHVRWKCIFGSHDYFHIGNKSGMTRSISGERGVTGTMRRVYKCECGAYKPAEKKDFI